MNNMDYNEAISGIAMLQDGGIVSDEGMMDPLSDPMISTEIEEIGKLRGSQEEQGGNALLEQQIVSLLERQAQGDANFSPEESQLLEAINAEAGGIEIDDDDDDDDLEDPRSEKFSDADIAEMKEAAVGLASLGRMGDDSIAHVMTGEVVLPAEMMEDPEFAQAMMTRFEAMGIDPRARVVGSGIASLNDISGLEEFGFLKKLGKSVKKRVKKVAKSVKKVAKKVIKPIAKVAQFIPGPWQPAAALISKVSTVYDVAKGNASPLALLSVAGPTAAGGSISSNVSALTKAGGSGGIGGLIKGLGSGLKSGAGAISSGIGSLLTDPKNALGNVGKVLNSATYSGQAAVPAPVAGSASAAGGSGFFGTGTAPQMSSNLTVPGFGGGTMTVGGGGTGLFGGLQNTVTGALNNATGGLFGQGQNAFSGMGNIGQLANTAASGGNSVSLFGGSPAGQFFNNAISGVTGIGAPQQGSFGAFLGNLVQGGGQQGGGQVPAPQSYQIQSGDTLSAIAAQYGVSVQDIMNANPSITDPNKIYAGNTITIPTMGPAPAGGGQQGGGGFLGGLGGLFGGGQQGGGQVVQQGGQPTVQYGPQGQPMIVYNQPQQQGGMSGLAKGLAAGIPALLLAKYAKDEAERDRGVVQNPMTSMSGMGRFNIEEEIARRTGKPAPNPVEYGLLPANTLPQVAASAPNAPVQQSVVVPTQAYADGGYVEDDFVEMDGEIAGAGTERSDSIPAMLSDGEFVMNGQAVRGAGGYQMMNDGGIITLIPSDDEDRGQGTQTMYDLMNEFQGNAMPARG